MVLTLDDFDRRDPALLDDLLALMVKDDYYARLAARGAKRASAPDRDERLRRLLEGAQPLFGD